MGAIIGGLYAAGYTASQLDSIVNLIDFESILLDEIPRKAKPFYQKEGGENFALTLPVINYKAGIPKAISQGQNVLNLLTELTQHVSNINDFSKLPIPFVCVAMTISVCNPYHLVCT